MGVRPLDVFVSYARSNEPLAQEVAEALQSVGYGVWRDNELPAHRPYAEVIEERLKGAKAVIVLWSEAAVQSQWVRAEADAARMAGTLVQVSIDGTAAPLPFNQIQCADLTNWVGNPNHVGWQKVQASVEALAGPPSGPSGHRNMTGRLAICVLPFENMSGDAEQEYFSDGISEDITTDLSNVSALTVTARNAAFTYKGRAVRIPDLARDLDISHVLEGSVRKSGGRVRITAQLVDGKTGDHVWAQRFDRDLVDIFAIQDEISKAIVEALKIRLLPEEKKAIEQRGTANAEAYNLYLMARQYWTTGNHGDIRREQRVVRLCQRAVEIDPEYARAWALMALSQVSLRFYYGARGDDGLAAAERALSLDPNIAVAYAVKARIHSEQQQFEAADREIAVALKLDPESWEVNREAARLAKAQRHIDDAARHYAKAVSIIETDYHSWALLVECHHARGDVEGVKSGAQMMVSQSEKVLAEDPSNGAALGICAGGHALLGHREKAMETIERALLIDPDNLNMRYNFGCILAGYLGEADAALDLLEPVLAEAKGTLVHTAAVDPDLDPLRGMERFDRILADAQRRSKQE